MADKVYEMLWDCPSCDTKKLLGKSQRFCPNCGDAQDPKSRYYPSDADKVAVEDHEFVGADVVCPACDVPNSAKATFCTACGADLKGGKTAVTRGEQESAGAFAAETAKDARTEHKTARLQREAAMQGVAPPTPPRSKTWMIVLGVVVAVIATVVVLRFWKKEATITVTGHQWKRVVALEKMGPKSEDTWCDSMPSDAYAISRRAEQRSTRKIADGQTCKTVRKDRGDGTYKESEKCETKYREEPVMGEKCYYTVNRWQHSRNIEAAGEMQPAWPAVSLFGGERESGRSEKYVVTLRTSDQKTHECAFDEATWAALSDGTSRKAKVRMVGGGVDCDSFKAAR